MNMPRQIFIVFVLVGMICLTLGLFIDTAMWAQQPEQNLKNQADPEETQDVIEPAPKDIKEAIGIFVFLGWMWLSIFVLIYILSQKIKEVDRVHRLKFFFSDKN